MIVMEDLNLKKRNKPVNCPKVETEYINNTKVMRELVLAAESLEQLNQGEFELVTSNKGAKRERSVLLRFEGDGINLSDVNISPFDWAVMDAIYTLDINDIKKFTVEAVARIMSGNMDASRKVTTQRCHEIIDSIERLSCVRITIDATKDLTSATSKEETSAEAKAEPIRFVSYMLPVVGVDYRRRNGSEGREYALIMRPALYTYAERKRRFVTADVDLWNVPGISDTTDAMLIKRCLIRRVELMKHAGNNMNSHRIAYCRFNKEKNRDDGLFIEIGMSREDYDDAGRKHEVHRKVKCILDSFREKKYIKDYTVVKNEFQEIYGIDVELGETEGAVTAVS